MKLNGRGRIVGVTQVAELDTARKAIAAAAVERDGRIFELRRLPGQGLPDDEPPLPIQLRHSRGFPLA